MQSASGYRFSALVDVASSRITVTGEFQAPDRIHEVVTSPGGVRAEALLVGTDSFVRDAATGRWHRTATASTATDPRTAFSVLRQATGVTLAGGRYVFSLPAEATARLLAGGSSGGPGSGTAVLAGGVIASLQISLSQAGRPVTVSLQYSSVGSAPPVTAPAGA